MNTTNLLLFYLVLAIFALTIAIMVYPTIAGGNKKKAVKKSSRPKSSKKKK